MPNDKLSTSSLKSKPVWVFAGGLLCVSAWMFFIGVLVGRGTAPLKFDIEKLEQTLLKKRLDADQKMQEALSAEDQNGPAKTDMEFYETLKGPRTDDRLPEIKAGPAVKSATGSDTKSGTELKPQTGQAAAAKEKPPNRISGRYTVQVASMRSKDSARKMAEKLINKGYDAFVASSSSSGVGTWYRVRIGHYKEKNEAKQMALQMERRSFRPIVVRQR